MVKMMPPDGAISYDLDGAAAVTGIGRTALYRAVKSGELPAKRTTPPRSTTRAELPGGPIIVLRRELEAFVENLPDDWWGFRY